MGTKIVTEADRKATPKAVAPSGRTNTTGHGQKVSLERGSHTRSKKNPGKRPRKGGCSPAACCPRRLRAAICIQDPPRPPC